MNICAKRAYPRVNEVLEALKLSHQDQIGFKAQQLATINAVAVMELVRDAPLLFEKSSEPEDKRRILNIIFRNLELHGDTLLLKYKKPFDSMAFCKKILLWLGMRDSNPRMLVPETSALPLGESPLHERTLFYHIWW